jgi:uncharacterized surface anchored protein
MYLAVRNFAALYPEIIKLIVKFSSGITSLQETIDEIQSISEKQGLDKKGLTRDKNALKKKLAWLAVKHSNKLAIIAKQSKSNDLLTEISFNESELLRLSEVTLRDKVQVIYDRVQVNIEALAEQGVTTDSQALFSQTLKAFNDAIATPRTVIAERQKATKRLLVLFESADAALEIMDLAAGSVKDEYPDFYNAYRSSRVQVNTSSGTIWLKASAKDLSGNPVKGALFSLMEESGSIGKLLKKTNEKGNFQVKNIQPGNYKVVITKKGYINKESKVIVNEGEKTLLNVELEKA